MPGTVGQELLNVPMGEMIRQMAFAIADGQFQLDTASIRMAEVMSGKQVLFDDGGKPTGAIDTKVAFGGQNLSMIELGFTPTFYQFIDTVIEVKIAIRISRLEFDTTKVNSRSITAGAGLSALGGGPTFVATATAVDGTYSSRYGYSAEGSSVLRTKLVPVPAPAILEERIRLLLAANKTNPNP